VSRPEKWVFCHDCGKPVNVYKPLLGSLHVCLTDEER
jgi:hypothetical protein